MRQFIVVTLLFWLPTLVFSQKDSSVIQYVSYWEKGDVYQFQVTKSDKRTSDGKVTKDKTSTYTATFEVMDSTDKSYTIRWYYDNFIGSNLEIPETLRDKLSEYDVEAIIYTTTELGEFKEVVNWKPISDMVKIFVDELYKEMAKEDGTNVNEVKKAVDPMVDMFTSKEGIQSLFLKELQYFHFPFGAAFNLRDTLKYVDYLPNMFGGTPIKGDARLYFNEVDFENERSMLIQELEIQDEAAMNYMKSILKRFGAPDDEMDERLKNAVFNISDYNYYDFYYYPGVPIKIETTRSTVFKLEGTEATRVDKTIVELIVE